MSASEPADQQTDSSGERPPSVTLAADDGTASLSWAWVRDRAAEVCARLGFNPFSLDLIVLDDRRMAELNRRFTGSAQTTDVLAFDLREPAGEAPPVAGVGDRPIDGELYLCLDAACRQASRRGHSVEAELLLYATHGLLHLVGEDDHAASTAQRMHAREDAILEAVGVGPVYGRAVHGGTASLPETPPAVSDAPSRGTDPRGGRG